MQVEAANTKLQEVEADLRGSQQRERELQEEHAKCLTALERGRVQVWIGCGIPGQAGLLLTTDYTPVTRT